MLFLGIILWKGVSCFNAGGRGFVFQMGVGFIFKWGVGGWGAPHGGIDCGGGGFKKNFKMGRVASPMPPTMGNPSVSILLVRYPIITTELFIAR